VEHTIVLLCSAEVLSWRAAGPTLNASASRDLNCLGAIQGRCAVLLGSTGHQWHEGVQAKQCTQERCFCIGLLFNVLTILRKQDERRKYPASFPPYFILESWEEAYP